MGAGLTAMNTFFVAFVLVAIPGLLIWAIRTAHRDHHTVTQFVAAPDCEQAPVVEEPEVPEAILGYILHA